MIKFFCITKINQFINHLQRKDIKHREREIRGGGGRSHVMKVEERKNVRRKEKRKKRLRSSPSLRSTFGLLSNPGQ